MNILQAQLTLMDEKCYAGDGCKREDTRVLEVKIKIENDSFSCIWPPTNLESLLHHGKLKFDTRQDLFSTITARLATLSWLLFY